MALWLTRPQEDSDAMAAELHAKHIAHIVGPIMDIAPVAFTLPSTKPAALVLTSRHAAAAIPGDWKTLPTYCVGKATADAATQHGCQTVLMGAGSALDLLPLIQAQQTSGETLVHLSGAEVKIDLTPLLAASGIRLERCVVYNAQPVPLTEAVCTALHAGSITGVVFYSPHSARIACELLGDDAAHLSHATAYCLSLDVAAAAASLPFARIISCPIPTQQAMMELLSQTAITAA